MRSFLFILPAGFPLLVAVTEDHGDLGKQRCFGIKVLLISEKMNCAAPGTAFDGGTGNERDAGGTVKADATVFHNTPSGIKNEPGFHFGVEQGATLIDKRGHKSGH